MSILVTGFGPFPGVQRNLSQAVVEALPDMLAGMALRRAVLPTEYRQVRTRLPALLAEARPDILLCLGVGRDLALETTARNCGDPDRPDQAGEALPGPAEPGGPDACQATLPLARMGEALAAIGQPARLSDDAGGYVCNFAFYLARRAVEAQGLPTRCGFLHLPPLDRGDEAGQTARMAAAVCAALEAAAGDA